MSSEGNLEAAKAVVDLPIGIRQQSGAYLSFSLAWPPTVRSLSGECEQQFDMVDSLSRRFQVIITNHQDCADDDRFQK